jgi:hypothetical protein
MFNLTGFSMASRLPGDREAVESHVQLIFFENPCFFCISQLLGVSVHLGQAWAKII